MSVEEAIKSLETLKAEIEWDYSLEYQIALDVAMRALKVLNDYLADINVDEIESHEDMETTAGWLMRWKSALKGEIENGRLS